MTIDKKLFGIIPWFRGSKDCVFIHCSTRHITINARYENLYDLVVRFAKKFGYEQIERNY